MDDVKTSLRLDPEIYDLWDRVARHMALKKAQVFKVALMELARRQGVSVEAAVSGSGSERAEGDGG